MRILDARQTAAALREYGLDAPIGPGFAHRERRPDTLYDWHTHAYHQLLYAATGTAQIETASARYLLPPGRAAWIPAGVEHRTLISDIDGTSLYFAPETVCDAGADLRILIAPPLMAEMIRYAARWTRGTSAANPLAVSFFGTLALLCGEWLESELPLRLPRSDHPAVTRAIDYALADPGAATHAEACAAACVSERTFRRVFRRETGMTWQAWLTQARILAAMSRLERRARVTDVAAEVGFSSLSAFAKAFARVTGETPLEYRRRARAAR